MRRVYTRLHTSLNLEFRDEFLRYYYEGEIGKSNGTTSLNRKVNSTEVREIVKIRVGYVQQFI